MSDFTNDTVAVQCLHEGCRIKAHVLARVCPDDNRSLSMQNSENWHYCPACRGYTVFQCPECLDWHEVRHLSTKPYVCPTVIITAIDKYESALVSYLIAYFIPIAIWFIIVFLTWLVLGHKMFISDYPFWSMLLIIPFGWFIGCLWVYIENKKRKANFQKECSKEWELMQRFSNRVTFF